MPSRPPEQAHPERWLSTVLQAAAKRAGIGLTIAVVEERVKHVSVSDTAAAFFGYTRDEFLALDPLSHFHEDGEDLLLSVVKHFAKEPGTASPLISVRARRKDGSPVSFQAGTHAVDLDGRPAVVSFLVDSSRRRQLEESIAANEERLIDVIDRMPDPVFVARGDEIVHVNRALRRLLFDSEAPIRDLSGIELRADRKEPGDGSDTTEEVTLAAGGRSVTLEVRTMQTELESRPALVFFGRDLTDQRFAEAHLMQADRLATLGTLAGGLAHAINNPLSSVVLNLEDLVRRMPELAERPELAAEVEERLTLAKEGADRVASVVGQLRIFSRMRRTDQSGDVDVRRVVEDGLELVANEIRHRGQLETSLRPVPPVHGVEGRIEQALLTLLIYAVRMLPDRAGGRARMLVETSARDGNAEIVVRCEGGPMGARTSNAGAPAGPTVEDDGIGLAICADILRSMRGDLVVSTNASQSVFRVRLPHRETAGEDRATDPGSVNPAVPGEDTRARILVIDDDPGVLGALRLMLQDKHDVTTMQDPRQAVRELLDRGTYDIIFSDFAMPGMTGEEVFEAVRQHRPGLERRIIFMTGAAFQRDVEAFFERVSNARIDKPFTVEQVEALVQRVVADRSGQRQAPDDKR